MSTPVQPLSILELLVEQAPLRSHPMASSIEDGAIDSMGINMKMKLDSLKKSCFPGHLESRTKSAGGN